MTDEYCTARYGIEALMSRGTIGKDNWTKNRTRNRNRNRSGVLDRRLTLHTERSSLPCPRLYYTILSYTILSCPVLSYPVLYYLIIFYSSRMYPKSVPFYSIPTFLALADFSLYSKPQVVLINYVFLPSLNGEDF